MLPWLMTLGLALGAPAPTAQQIESARSRPAPLQVATDAPVIDEAAPVPSSAPAATLEGPVVPAPPTQAERRAAHKRETMGKRLVIGGAAAYGVGMALTWGSAAGADALGPGTRRRDAVGSTIGMVFGGSAMFEGVLLTGLGANQMGKKAPNNNRKSRALRGGGGALMGVGALGLVGTGLMYGPLRDACPAGAACGLAAFQASGMLLTAGSGMVGYGKAVRASHSRARLPRKAREPLIAGLSLMGAGYFTAAVMGTALWSGNDSAPARRIRNRMYIPVVGPWIVAAGPDARFFMAAVTGGIGLMQIGGAAAATVGAIKARHGHEPRVVVVPTGTGATVTGRF